MIEIKEYVSGAGENPFQRWFDELDPQAAAIVTIAIGRLGEGNTSNVKSISGGVAAKDRSRAGLSRVFRLGRQGARDPSWRRHETKAAERYRNRAAALA